jgi:methylated-DNA-[protein]-cysteine S-methyltransferase
MMIFKSYYRSPVGLLQIISDGEGIIKISFAYEEEYGVSNRQTEEAVNQLQQYFAGERTEFELPLKISGTPFQKRVYNALLKVPYGSTVSYKDLTIMAGNNRGFQATGQAVHRNQHMIVIPCHRVISNDGSIGGYTPDVNIKKRLLKLEGGWKMDYN